jgi:hypothetical protein
MILRTLGNARLQVRFKDDGAAYSDVTKPELGIQHVQNGLTLAPVTGLVHACNEMNTPSDCVLSSAYGMVYAANPGRVPLPRICWDRSTPRRNNSRDQNSRRKDFEVLP